MGRKILMEVDLGAKALERCDIAVYVDDKLLTTIPDKSYADLQSIAHELKSQYQTVIRRFSDSADIIPMW